VGGSEWAEGPATQKKIAVEVPAKDKNN